MGSRRHNRPRITAIALVLLAIACGVLLAACGGSSSKTSSQPGSSTSKPGASSTASSGTSSPSSPQSEAAGAASSAAESKAKASTEEQRLSSLRNLENCLKKQGALTTTKSSSGVQLESKNPAKVRESVKKCGTVIPKQGLIPGLGHKPKSVSPGKVATGPVSPGSSAPKSTLEKFKSRIGAYLSCLKEHGVFHPGGPAVNTTAGKQQYKEASQACRSVLF